MMKVTNDFYKQFEEMCLKLDKVLEENNKLKNNQKNEMIEELKKQHKEEIRLLKEELKNEAKENKKILKENLKNIRLSFRIEKEDLKDTIKSLEKTIEEKDKTIKKLLDEIDRLKNQINKNSNNSSKPSSTNISTPKKKTGANLYNYRKKTNKKPGGQKGHTGYSLSKEKIEQLIKDKKIEVKEIYHKTNNRNKKDIVKYRLGLNISVYAEKHIFKHDENSKDILPKEFYTDVTYDNKIKALCVELGTYNVVAYDRMSDFFNVISNGILTISNGTLVNFNKEFSNNSKSILDNFETEILNSEIIFTDETSGKYNKSNIYVRNYSNEKTVLYKSHKRKGHRAIKDQDILTKFSGGIVHDHDTTMYSYGTKHYECIIHLGRYLEEIIENVKNISWPRYLKKLLFEINKKRKQLINQDINCFTDEEIKNYEMKYDEIIALSKKENEDINSSFYKSKARTLSNRCEKYKENHLAFIKDFNVPFDNNLSERELRIIKTKTKVSGGFRSEDGCENYCNIISIINTAKKRNINPFKAIISVFNKQNIFAC